MEITYADFEKLNLKVATIKAVQPHSKTNDYVLLIDIGGTGADKQLVADLKESYSMDELVGKQIVFVQNIKEPVLVEGVESLGLVLVAHKDGKPVLVQPAGKVVAGSKVVGLSNVEVGFHE